MHDCFKEMGKDVGQNSRFKGIAFVLFASLLWGVSGTCAQYLFQHRGFDAQWLVSVRLLAAGVLLLAYSYAKERRKIFAVWKEKGTPAKLVLFGIVGMVGVQYSYFASIQEGNAATATILQFLAPVITMGYLALRNRKVPSLQEFAAVALAVGGTFLIITKGNIHTLAVPPLAVFWGIVSAFTVTFYTLYPMQLLQKFSPASVVGWGMLIGGAALSFVRPPWVFAGTMDVMAVLALLSIILLGTAVSFYLYLDSLKYIHPVEISVLSSAEPLTAAALSVLFLNVSLGLIEWVGILCVIATVIMLSFSKNKKD